MGMIDALTRMHPYYAIRIAIYPGSLIATAEADDTEIYADIDINDPVMVPWCLEMALETLDRNISELNKKECS